MADISDVATRERLLAASARLFAERGFSQVTIRDISRAARANIAAVNYHFAGKAGLYDEVVSSAIDTMQAATAETIRAGERRSADDRLRAYVTMLLERVTAPDAAGWVHHIMLRELSQPTPALDRIVGEVMAPRLAYLGGIVAELLSCETTDPRVARCTFSIHAQCLALVHRPIADLLRPDSKTAALDVMADHITEFSLAGLWAIART